MMPQSIGKKLENSAAFTFKIKLYLEKKKITCVFSQKIDFKQFCLLVRMEFWCDRANSS